jgi:hypothetical protein
VRAHGHRTTVATRTLHAVDPPRSRFRATAAVVVLALGALVLPSVAGAGPDQPRGDQPPGSATDVLVDAATSSRPAAEGDPAAEGPIAPDLPTPTPAPTGTPDTTATPGPTEPAVDAGLVPRDADRRTDDEVPPPPTTPPSPPTATTDEGFSVLLGSSEAGAGPTVTFTVEVEPDTGIAPAEALAVAEDALFDPRSWGRDVHLLRVDDPADADIRLVFALPSTTDELCGEAGLRTHGVYSCWTGPYAGRFAVINSWRYAFGAAGFADQAEYRRYVVNHEVGHGLGHGHVGCPAAGAPAPVMMQQSASLGGCVANGWPYPDG